MFTAWDARAFVTDGDLPLAEVEADHRRHAIVERTIAELKSAGLAYLLPGSFMANAAWLALAVTAHELGRAVGQLAGVRTRDRSDAAPQDVRPPSRAGSSTAADDGTCACACLRPVHGPTRSCAR